MAESDTGLVFVIDGADYPSPDIETFNMSERRVMFDLSGIVEEDFVRAEDETDDEHTERVAKMARHPGFIEALMHIAYARGNPDVKRAKVQAVIDQTNFQEAIAKWGDVEDESLPSSGSTSEPTGLSPTDSSGSNGSSGITSPTSSDTPARIPASTGITASDTSATSARNLSAV